MDILYLCPVCCCGWLLHYFCFPACGAVFYKTGPAEHMTCNNIVSKRGIGTNRLCQKGRRGKSKLLRLKVPKMLRSVYCVQGPVYYIAYLCFHGCYKLKNGSQIRHYLGNRGVYVDFSSSRKPLKWTVKKGAALTWWYFHNRMSGVLLNLSKLCQVLKKSHAIPPLTRAENVGMPMKNCIHYFQSQGPWYWFALL